MRNWPLLVLALVLCGGGCSSAWKQVPTADAPWIEPGRRAVLVRRSTEFPVAAYSERAWAGRRDTRVKTGNVTADIHRHLVRTGIVEQWPRTSDAIDSEPLRAAPFDFTLVSVMPTVVLMRPIPVESADNTRATMRGLINKLRAGTTVPASPGLMWFSPDLKRGPEPVEESAPGRVVIPLRKDYLVLDRRGDRVVASRKSASELR
jgi:hypothetical protein